MTVTYVHGYFRNPKRPRVTDDKHTELRVSLALEDWEQTFTAEALRQIETESREQAERIRESW